MRCCCPVTLTKFNEVGCEPDHGSALNQGLRYCYSNCQAVPGASAAPKLINDGKAVVVDVAMLSQ